MNIKERTVVTYETEDGQVFESLADARAYALQAQGCSLIEEGIKVGEFNVVALREPDDYVAFMAAKNNDNDNRFLFSSEDEMQYPLFICERKVIEENEEGFVVYYEYDHLAKVIQQQQMICGDLEFAFMSLSVQTIPEEIEEEIEEPEVLPDEPVEEEQPMQPEVNENPEGE